MNNFTYFLALVYTFSQVGIPSYLLFRFLFLLKPIAVNAYCDGTIKFYTGFNRKEIHIISLLTMLSILLSCFVTVNILESTSVFFTSINIFSFVFAQVFLLFLFEGKTPNSIFALILFYSKNVKQIFTLYNPELLAKQNPYIAQENILKTIEDKIKATSGQIFRFTSNIITKIDKDILSKLDQNNASLKETRSAITDTIEDQYKEIIILKTLIDTKTDLIIDSNSKHIQELVCERNIERKDDIIKPREKQYSKDNLLEICRKYKISLDSLQDVEDIITGNKIKNKIIFTGVHNRRYSKKLVVEFFKDHFTIYNEDGKLNSYLNQENILNFINTNIEFKSDKELKKNQILFVVKSTLSKK